jgi:hypothetical protein
MALAALGEEARSNCELDRKRRVRELWKSGPSGPRPVYKEEWPLGLFFLRQHPPATQISAMPSQRLGQQMWRVLAERQLL